VEGASTTAHVHTAAATTAHVHTAAATHVHTAAAATTASAKRERVAGGHT
jgi:hypothetical protein